MIGQTTASTTRLTCQLCDAPMTLQAREGSPVRYHHCAHCGRWVASNYRDELLRTGTTRVAREAPKPDAAADFDRIKARMAAWMKQLDESDPYHVLGISPRASDDAVRARFHQLALENHPDRGGDANRMRRILNAWEQVRRIRQTA